MARIHGKNTVILLGSDDISSHVSNSEMGEKADSHDLTTYGKDAHVYGGGLLDGTFKLDGVYDSTAVTGPRAVIQPLLGTTVVLTRRPEGTGSGLPQDVVDLVLTSYVETNPVAGYVTWSAEGNLSDDIDTTPQA